MTPPPPRLSCLPQAKNLIVLYDAVGTLAAAVGDAFAAPEHMGVIMPALIAKWESTPGTPRAKKTRDSRRDKRPGTLVVPSPRLSGYRAPALHSTYNECVHR